MKSLVIVSDLVGPVVFKYLIMSSIGKRKRSSKIGVMSSWKGENFIRRDLFNRLRIPVIDIKVWLRVTR